MGATQVPMNSTARRTFITRGNDGAPVNADVLPTIEEVHLNGVDVDSSPFSPSINPTVVQLTAAGTSPELVITGYYEVSFSTVYANVASGDLIAIKLSATIGGIVTTATAEFTIDPSGTARPFIDVS